MAAQSRVDFGGILRPPGQLDASTALEPYRGPLDERSAAHLLRRAGFGGTPDEVRRYASMPVDRAVESLVRFPSTANLPLPEVYDRTQHVSELRAPGEGRKAALKEILGNERESIAGMRLWWLNRMLTTPSPLQEKMTLFWHGHFTSFDNYAIYMFGQNQLFRQYAAGNARALTHAVSIDPAMLIWLNNDKNVAGHPNENYARELMELFTLGIGHYTEQDVREAARAWTGWRLNKATGVVRFDPRQHDDGTKTFLGQTGNFNGDDIVDIIFAQPQCARFLSASLLNFFVYNDPEPELIDAVARVMQRNNYELAPVLSAIFRSNVFYSSRAYRSLVKSPVEFVVGTYKSLGVAEIPVGAVAFVNRMGQELFHPPNVAGWPGGQNWLTSGTMVVRSNFIASVANTQTISNSSWLNGVPMEPNKATHEIAANVLQGDVAPASRFQLEALLGGAGTSALRMLSPENYGQRIGQATSLAMTMPAYQLN